MMTKFTVKVKNKVKMTGIIQGSGYKCSNSEYLYGLNVVRPQIKEYEAALCRDNCVMDCYSLLINKDDLSEGDIVEVKGVYGYLSGFDHKMICPICGKEQTKQTINMPVIKNADIRIVQSGDYHHNLDVLERMPNRFNHITVYDMSVNDIVLMRNDSYGMGDLTIYESKDFCSTFIHKGFDELVRDRYHFVQEENSFDHKIYIRLDRNDNYQPIKGVIHKARGRMALSGSNYNYDSFSCERCSSYVKVDKDDPMILFDKKPELEMDDQETKM